MSTLITRVVVSSAARLSGTIDSYDAIFPWEIRGVISVSLVSATIPYPEQFLVSGAYVILRIDGMEVSMSNDDVLDRCFVAIPCVDNIQKILPIISAAARRRFGGEWVRCRRSTMCRSWRRCAATPSPLSRPPPSATGSTRPFGLRLARPRG